jgi:hypothetical protein
MKISTKLMATVAALSMAAPAFTPIASTVVAHAAVITASQADADKVGAETHAQVVKNSKEAAKLAGEKWTGDGSSSTANKTTSSSSSTKKSTSTSSSTSKTSSSNKAMTTSKPGTTKKTTTSTTKKTTTTAKKSNFRLSYKGVAVTKRAASLYSINGANLAKTSKTLKKNTAWRISALVSLNGVDYYQVGTNQYLSSKDASFRRTGTAHVNYNKQYGIQIWTATHGFVKNANGSAKKLPGQTNWKVFGKAVINGKTYYNLGGDQYIDAAYVIVK